MTRVLPWLTDGNNATKATKINAQPHAKRRRLLDPASEADATPTAPRAKAQSKGQGDRTPSSSPPPLQPPTVSPLRPGLDGDDIYVMVEDEFLATAQTFTRHLHHAEYQRLKALAKSRNPPSTTSITRPTDGKTVMREELKRQKQGDKTAAKTKVGVEAILSRARATGDSQKDESEESDFEMDRGDEPWQGTQLQRFMTASPRKDLRSLTGLQGVTSHTRAAAGYGKSDPKSPSKSSRGFKRALLNDASADLAEDDEDDDTDDLEAPIRPPLRPPAQAQFSKKVHAHHHPTTRAQGLQSSKVAPSKPKPTAPRSFLDMSPPSAPARNIDPDTSRNARPSSSSASNYQTGMERSPSPLRANKEAKADPAAAVRAKMKARREREGSEKKENGGSGTVKDVEIPLFLV